MPPSVREAELEENERDIPNVNRLLDAVRAGVEMMKHDVANPDRSNRRGDENAVELFRKDLLDLAEQTKEYRAKWVRLDG